MKKLVLPVVLLCFCTQSMAQGLQELLDSSNKNWETERYEEAFNDLSQAVELAKKEYEAEKENATYNYAYILNQMGVRLFAAENYEVAESYYLAAMPIYKDLQGDSGNDYLVTMENLALCYNSHGKPDDALKIYNTLLQNEKYKSLAGTELFQTYNTAAICAYQTDNYDTAKMYYLQALAFLDEERPDNWVILENLILLEKDWAKYAEAYPYLEKLLTKFPEKEKEYANLKAYYYRDLGHVAMNKGNYTEAIPHLKQTLEYLLPTDSIAKLSVVYALQDLSACYVNSRQYQEGFQYFVQNETSTRDHYGAGSEDHLYALNYLSLAASELGDAKSANRYYKQAFRLIEKSTDAGNGEMGALFETNFCDYLIKQGRYTEAKEYCLKALGFYEAGGDQYFDDKVFSMNQLGILLLSVGKYEKAEALLKQTLKLQMDRNGIENEMGTKIASNLTSLYIQTGRGSRAVQFLEFILANDLNIHGPQSFEYSFSLQVAGVLFATSGDHDLAIDALQKAYDIRKALVGDKNREVLRLKQSLGTAYYKAGKNQEAEKMLTEILKIQEETVGDNNFDIALTQNDLALVYLANKDYQKAGKLFEKSYKLKKAVLGRHNQFTITSLFNLACTHLLTGQKDKAFELFQQSMGDYLYVLDKYFPYLSEKERLEYFHTIKGQLGAYFSFLNDELNAHPEYASVLYDLRLKTKAMLLNESMKLRNFLNRHQDEKVRQAYHTWVGINEEIAKMEQQSKSNDQAAYLDSLKVVGEEFERALNSLTGVNTETKSVTWKDIASSLKEGEAAIEIIRINAFDFEKNERVQGKATYLAMLIDNKTVDHPKFFKIGDGQLMDTKYFNVYKNNIKFKLKDEASFGNYWKAIERQVGDASKVFLSSDGVYHLINPNTLFDPEKSQYVLANMDVEIVGNTAELTTKKTTRKKPTNATLFGFPNFNVLADASSHDSLRSAVYRDIFTNGVSDLQGTKVEVANINSLMASNGVKSNSFLADDAHEGQLKKVRSSDILHIATHGFFEESSQDLINDDPLLHSGLLLANIKESAGIEEENGIITAKEVAGLNLQDNQLVVLSACETGKGKVVDGEGVYGLQRAFQVAGADNVVISLWKVDDTATQQLMTYFYESYLQTNDARGALKLAQTRLMADYPHPYYWGAFYVVGV